VNIHDKLNDCLIISGIENNVFRPQTTLRKTRIKLYNTLVLAALSFGSENWTIKARDTRRITAAEMKCDRKTAGCTWTDDTTNTEIKKN